MNSSRTPSDRSSVDRSPSDCSSVYRSPVDRSPSDCSSVDPSPLDPSPLDPSPLDRSRSRRSLLRAAGLAGLVASAGCLARAGKGSTPRSTPRSTPTDRAQRTAVYLENEQIETLGTDCGAGGVVSATVTERDGVERLAVSGTMSAPNPCHRAVYLGSDVFEAGGYSGREGEDADSEREDSTGEWTPSEARLHARFGVEVNPTFDACVECVGAVDFAFTADVVGRPDEIEVSTPSGHTVWTRE